MPQSLQAPGESREAPAAGEIDPSPPAPCALQTFAERVGDQAGERARGRSHPSARAFATVAAGGYAVVTALLIALGLLLTHGPLSGSIGGRDDWATSWLADRRSGAMDGITKVLSLSADTIGAIGIALVVAIVFAFGRRWQAIAALVVGLTLELLVFLTVNYVVGRPRPDVLKMGTEPSTSSFPSGHTAATTVIYVLVAVVVTASTTRVAWRALAWAAAVVMPVAVGFARVYRGMHHPTDVVAGVVMGIAVLVVALAAVRAAQAASSPARSAADLAEPPGDRVRPDLLGAAG